ncbi:hypothetical protein [Paraburkholderia atlantica]|uniref:hypothetical protein n=1 Tax=Paraburkholderia atlantica TaxID=2654982 RepID=UPI0016148847|nr:hypothetical protein [Paraburkholderia atlantica]MBB5414072.1 hypothetical protein [Paraburkholderia atlantica]
MRGNLWDDPRVARLVEITDSSEAAVIGGLYWLWATADQHSEDGVMPGMTPRTIDRKTGVLGLGAALVTIGWIEVDDEGLTITRFDEHNGTSAKKRAVTAKRVANHRSTADVTQEALPNEQDSVTSALAREREREDKTLEPNGSVDSGEKASPTADLLGGGEGNSEQTGERSAQSIPACPVQQIVDLYHECMPLNPRVKVLDDARKGTIRARWKQAAQLDSVKPFGYATGADGLKAWRTFFTVCAESEFLTGRATPRPGKKPFVADIDFLTSPKGFKKCLENRYHEDD